MSETTLWSGHIAIAKDDNGDNLIHYRADSAPPEVPDSVYAPHGFFETHAVNVIIKKLAGAA